MPTVWRGLLGTKRRVRSEHTVAEQLCGGHKDTARQYTSTMHTQRHSPLSLVIVQENPCSENKNYSNHRSLRSNVGPLICLLSRGVWVKEDCEHLRVNHGVKTLSHVGRAWWAGPPHCDGTHKAALWSARTPQLSPLLASTDIYHSKAFQNDSPTARPSLKRFQPGDATQLSKLEGPITTQGWTSE